MIFNPIKVDGYPEFFVCHSDEEFRLEVSLYLARYVSPEEIELVRAGYDSMYAADAYQVIINGKFIGNAFL